MASTVRAVPYPLPAQVYQFPPAASVAVPAAVVPRVAPASSNPLPATHQQPQTAQQQQEQCRCRGAGDEDGGCGDTAAPPTTTPSTTAISLNTPMLFVPFSVPNFAPPIAGSNLGTNSTSPSGGTTPAKVGGTLLLPVTCRLIGIAGLGA